MFVYLIVGVLGIFVLVVSRFDFSRKFAAAFSGPRVFSFPAIGGFFAGFGLGSALYMRISDVSMTRAAVGGCILGLSFASFALVTISALLSEIQHYEYEGTVGVVIVSVPAGGYGQIKVLRDGRYQKFNAYAKVSISAGDKVLVRSVLSPTAFEVVKVKNAD